MKKLILSIALALLSLPSFSQSVTDTTLVILPNDLARLVIQDLIAGDAAKEELVLVRRKLELSEQKIISQEEIILRLESQIDNLEKVEITRADQLSEYKSLTTRLETDLNKERRLVSIFKATTGVGMLGVLVVITVI